MYNYELHPKLKYLALTVDNTAESWEDKLEFIGTKVQWTEAKMLEEILST